MFILGTGDKYRYWLSTTEDNRPVSRRKPPSGSRSIKNIPDPDGKRRRRRGDTSRTRADDILSLSPSVSSLHVLPISRMSVYIFLTTFFSNPTVGSFLPLAFSLFVSFLSSGHAYRVFFFLLCLYLSFILLPSFPELPGNVCAFHPEKWIFSFGKKSEKSAYSLQAARGSLLARVQTKRFRASAVARRTIEKKGVEGGGKRIESKTATVAKGK